MTTIYLAEAFLLVVGTILFFRTWRKMGEKIVPPVVRIVELEPPVLSERRATNPARFMGELKMREAPILRGDDARRFLEAEKAVDEKLAQMPRTEKMCGKRKKTRKQPRNKRYLDDRSDAMPHK